MPRGSRIGKRRDAQRSPHQSPERMLILKSAVRQPAAEDRPGHDALVQQGMSAQERQARMAGSRARP